MKPYLTFIVSLGLFMFFSSPLKAAAPEAEFWQWFQKHENELYDFEKDQGPVFDRLSAALVKVDANLTFEFGPKRNDGKREFVISAGGIRSAFPKVEALYSTAPKLERWIVIKFRPRRTPINDLQYRDKKVKAAEVRCLMFKDDKPNKVGILLFLPGFQRGEEKNDFGQIGYLFLDEALGEYDMETKVGAVVLEERSSKYFQHSTPLSELAGDFDAHFRSLNKSN